MRHHVISSRELANALRSPPRAPSRWRLLWGRLQAWVDKIFQTGAAPSKQEK